MRLANEFLCGENNSQVVLDFVDWLTLRGAGLPGSQSAGLQLPKGLFPAAEFQDRLVDGWREGQRLLDRGHHLAIGPQVLGR